MKLVYFGNINNGQLKIINRHLFDADIASMEGKQVEIVVSPKKKTRSNQQNRYYWSVVVGLIKEGFVSMGHDGIDSQNVHAFLTGRFLFKEIINENGGEVIRIPMGTSGLTTTEMMVYIDQCAQFASEYLNVIIPPPSSQTEFNYD